MTTRGEKYTCLACVWMCVFALSSVTLTEWEQLPKDHSHYYFSPFRIDTRCIEHNSDTPFFHCSHLVKKQPVDPRGTCFEMCTFHVLPSCQLSLWAKRAASLRNRQFARLKQRLNSNRENNYLALCIWYRHSQRGIVYFKNKTIN